jgi:hypothetical protein
MACHRLSSGARPAVLAHVSYARTCRFLQEPPMQWVTGPNGRVLLSPTRSNSAEIDRFGERESASGSCDVAQNGTGTKEQRRGSIKAPLVAGSRRLRRISEQLMLVYGAQHHTSK